MIRLSSGTMGSSRGLFDRPGRRLSISLILLLSLALFILGKVEHPLVTKIRMGLQDVVTPVMSVLSVPVEWASDASDWFAGLTSIYEQNERLREDNTRLRDWKAIAERLDLENTRLRNLLNAPESPVDTLVTPRVVAVQGGPYVRSVLVNAGADFGVRDGLAVTTRNGVVGRVLMAGAAASRVLLITDFNSRVPVRVERTGQNGVAVGRNGQLLSLSYLPVDMDVVIGDRILTSGDGGVFPPDLPFGAIVAVTGVTVDIRPLADLENLDFVRILRFDPRTMEPGEDQVEPGEDQVEP